MLILKKVAVTGGLSCGKSSVCRLFKDLGAYVMSADEIVHQLLSPETQIGQEVIKLIGFDSVVEGQIDRKVIAKKVFNQPKLLHSLENILHPAVHNAIESEYKRLTAEGKKGLFVAEIPLFFESRSIHDYDAVIAVIASDDVAEARFVQEGHSKEEFHKRMSRQIAPQEKARRADFVIRNDGSWEDLKRAVKEIYNTLTTM